MRGRAADGPCRQIDRLYGDVPPAAETEIVTFNGAVPFDGYAARESVTGAGPAQPVVQLPFPFPPEPLPELLAGGVSRTWAVETRVRLEFGPWTKRNPSTQ